MGAMGVIGGLALGNFVYGWFVGQPPEIPFERSLFQACAVGAYVLFSKKLGEA